MRRSKLIPALLAAVLTLSGCYSYGDEEETAGATSTVAPSPSVTFGEGRALLHGEGEAVLIDVEVAETEEQHRLGLMHRESLAEDAGMAFVYFEDMTAGMWMKNTKIPLSVAFFDENGVIVDIIDMEPCETESCPVYTPEEPYRGALEVNQGAFEEWGIRVGDRISITR